MVPGLGGSWRRTRCNRCNVSSGGKEAASKRKYGLARSLDMGIIELKPVAPVKRLVLYADTCNCTI
jgi:hypothetical protein